MIKELVAHIVKQLVNHPDDVKISVHTSDDKQLIEITVNEQDRGKVIGREGHIVKALRLLVNAIASDDKKVAIEVAR